MGTIEGPTDGMAGLMGVDSVDPGRDPASWSADVAISALYAAHWRGLVRLAWLLVHDQQVAEDVAQEAFVATYRRWSSLRSPEAAVPYLRTATVNGSRSALRKRGVRERYAAARAAGPDPERHVDSAETVALVTLGISRGAVKSHASRAMSTLRQRLATGAQPEDLS